MHSSSYSTSSKKGPQE
jgi:kinesin family member 12